MITIKDTPFGKYPVLYLPEGTSKAKKKKLENKFLALQLECICTSISDEEFIAKWNEIEEAVLNAKTYNH